LRWQILEREGFRCLLCKGAGVPLRIRFLKPVAFGGLEEAGNLGAICDICGGFEADVVPAVGAKS
jgi:hypothetical protein